MYRKVFIFIGIFALIGCLLLIMRALSTPVYSQENLRPDYQLLVMSLRGDTSVVRLLLQSGVDPNTPPGANDKGMTALMFATWKGHDEISRLLVRAGANVNAVGNNGSTPLMYAAAKGNVHLVNFLLANGANPNSQRHDGMIAIMFAFSNGRLDAVRSLARVTSVNLLNSVRFANQGPLIVTATKIGSPEMVEALLQANISLEQRDRFGQTALMYAARGGYTQIASKLLRKGANVNARDSRGVTPLTKAIVGNRTAVIQVLRSRGARS